jgi:two-component system secretion response regulator SsrB
LGWLQALRQRCPDLKVIVLSVHDEESVRRAAMEAGADAFVLKRAIATDLLSAVDAVRGSESEEVSTADTKAP